MEHSGVRDEFWVLKKKKMFIREFPVSPKPRLTLPWIGLFGAFRRLSISEKNHIEFLLAFLSQLYFCVVFVFIERCCWLLCVPVRNKNSLEPSSSLVNFIFFNNFYFVFFFLFDFKIKTGKDMYDSRRPPCYFRWTFGCGWHIDFSVIILILRLFSSNQYKKH